MLLEVFATPPATAASESTSRIASKCGTEPSSSRISPSLARPKTVPIVSKKSLSMSEKTASDAATTPIAEKPPNRLTWPIEPKSGDATRLSGSFGTLRLQPFGFTTLPSGPVCGPTCATASMMIDRTSLATMPMRIAPRTFLATRTR